MDKECSHDPDDLSNMHRDLRKSHFQFGLEYNFSWILHHNDATWESQKVTVDTPWGKQDIRNFHLNIDIHALGLRT